MHLEFRKTALVGNHVYVPGETGVVDYHRAVDLIESGAAVEHVQPPPAPIPSVREAVAVEPKQARKAVSRG